MKSKQTSVDWLKSNLPSLFINDSGHYQELFKQAIQMEREQIVSAVHYGIRSPYTNIQTIHPQIEITKGEQYYEQTYGTDKN